MLTRVDVFEQIFLVFLGLGTLIGILVVVYTLRYAYIYRDRPDREEDEYTPQLGELPTGGKGGKKMFISFGLSAIVVISLVVWTYSMLLYVEAGPGDNPGEDAIEIEVEGFAFGWSFYYEDGVDTTGTMYVPADTPVWVQVTATDVWHAFGIPDQRVKADAIPGEYSETWFEAEEPGEYEDAIECFELCGAGHSNMKADLVVLEQDEYDEWLEEERAEAEEEEEEEDTDE